MNPRWPTRDFGEFAHMIVLPPPADDPTSSARRILLVPRRHFLTGNGAVAPRSYVWDAGAVTDLEVQIVHLATQENQHVGNLGVADPFCGGHAQTEHGDVFWAGGTNYVESALANDIPYGHEHAFLFRNDAAPSWISSLETPSGSPPMQWERWYPSVFATGLASAPVMVVGHDQLPALGSDGVREHVAVGTSGWTWSGAPENHWWTPSNCSATDLLETSDYPKIHVLGSRFALWVGRNLPSGWRFGYIDLDRQVCPSDERWIEGDASTLPASSGGNSVHFLRVIDQFGAAEEVVYTLGGRDASADEKVTNRVARLSIPANATASVLAGLEWDDTVPALNIARKNSNAVILLDGSILVLGGERSVDNVWTACRMAERYKPPEIFDAPSAAWKVLGIQSTGEGAQPHERRYHSTAALLADGRVASSGGVSDLASPPEESWNSIDLFSPMYFFLGPRPRIASISTGNPASMTYNGTVDVEVALRTTEVDEEFRVALIGPGSVTHGINLSQRYIVLWVSEHVVNPDPNGISTITVHTPKNSFVAPPGWYMLTVVNSKGRPSGARWVKVG